MIIELQHFGPRSGFTGKRRDDFAIGVDWPWFVTVTAMQWLQCCFEEG